MAEVAGKDQGSSQVFVYTDKTMLRLSGITVRGLNAGELEKLLTEELGGLVRVIGVTGQSIDMDVYGLDEERILRSEAGLIQAVALAEGITLTDLARLACSGKARAVDAARIPERTGYCVGERWRKQDA